MKNLKRILKKHGYKIAFQPLHKKSDILKYQNKPDAVGSEIYLTILTKEGHVVGRLYTVNKEQALTKSDILKIMTFFTMFDIPHAKACVKHLRDYLDTLAVPI